MLYSAYQPLVLEAKPRSEIWRLLVGLGLVAVIFFVLNRGYFFALHAVLGPEDWQRLGQELDRGTSPRAVVVMLYNYLALGAAMLLVARFLHQRGLLSLIGPARAVLRDFAKVFVALMALNLAYWILPLPGKAAPEPYVDPDIWLRWLPVALVGLLLQTGCEELVFRGYIQSQIAARFRSTLIWLLFPSLVFAALHFDPASFGSNAKWVALWAGLFAFAAADVTARAGNLGPAIAMHFVNNTGALLVNAVAGNWDGLALQTLQLDPQDAAAFQPVILLETGLILMTWLMTRLAIRR